VHRACDGLKGLPDAIVEIWPQASVQLCVVHLVRASLRYASKARWSPITKALRTVYTAATVDAAAAAFAEFEADWGDRYPAIIRLWRNAWDTFTPFLMFPPEIRRVVYTTDEIVKRLAVLTLPWAAVPVCSSPASPQPGARLAAGHREAAWPCSRRGRRYRRRAGIAGGVRWVGAWGCQCATMTA
jgi:transposase-like protein